MFKNGQTFYLPYKCAVNILEFIPVTTYLSAAVDMLFISSAASTTGHDVTAVPSHYNHWIHSEKRVWGGIWLI